jgi:hypothetical protein
LLIKPSILRSKFEDGPDSNQWLSHNNGRFVLIKKLNFT